MKRTREEEEEEEEEDMANLLLSLSSKPNVIEETNIAKKAAGGGGDDFICKTCSRRFASFQALGGHRTSHKRVKGRGDESNTAAGSEKAKRGVHECSICGLGFSMGQALGGHMRRHRAAPPVESLFRGWPEVIDLNLAPSEEDGCHGDCEVQLLQLFT